MVGMNPNKMGKMVRSMRGKDKTKVAAAFHEVMTDEPSTVSRAKVSEARKKKMRIAIALAKARKAGAKIPYRKSR